MHATQLGYRRLKYFLHVILSRLPRGGGSRSLYFFLLKVANYKFRSPTNADRDGRGPFWAACATRDTKIAARLLQAGADVDEQDNNGVTALRYAVAHGNADVAEFLRAHGAAEVEGGRLSISPSAAGTEVPETFTNPSPRSAGEASSAAASL